MYVHNFQAFYVFVIVRTRFVLRKLKDFYFSLPVWNWNKVTNIYFFFKNLENILLKKNMVVQSLTGQLVGNKYRF